MIPPGALVVGTIAELRKEQRYDVWIDVAHAVCDANPAVHFLAVGEGPIAGELRDRIRATGHRARIHLVDGRSGLPRELGAFDLYLNTGNADAATRLHDALAAGVPVISAASAGARELVRHNAEGLLVAPGDRAAFVSVVESLLGDPERRARLGAAARERAASVSTATAC